MTAATALIKRFEGYAKRLPNDGCTTYLCSAGVVTIGYGSTGDGVTAGACWTRDKADARFDADLVRFSKNVFALSPILKDEPIRSAAIISFAYNIGIGAYKNSALRKAVNRGDWDEAKRQLLRWDKVKGKPIAGLTRRRQAEALLL